MLETALLNINEETVSLAELNRAYKKAVLKFHPDKGGRKEDFQLLQKQYNDLLVKVDSKRKNPEDENLISDTYASTNNFILFKDTKLISNGTDHKNIVLLIPFSAKENNRSLYSFAQHWQEAMKKKHQFDKVPSIIIYAREDETECDKQFYNNAQFQFNEQTIKPNTTIYIMAHGIGDPNLVSNTDPSDPNDLGFIMPIALIAERVKEMGLTPDLIPRLKGIKLFICDEAKLNQSLAANFAYALGEDYKHLNVSYYTASVVCIPDVKRDGKRALVHSLNAIVDVGRASEFRETFKIGDILTNQTQPSYNANFFFAEKKAIAVSDLNQMHNSFSCTEYFDETTSNGTDIIVSNSLRPS